MPKKLNDLISVDHPSLDARMYVLNNADSSPVDRRVRLGNLISLNFISGLQMEWISGNSVRVKTGAAALPDGRLIRVTSDKTLSAMTLAANTWYHLYLDTNGNIQYLITAPSVPYFGTARTQSDNTNRRYLGSVITDGSGNILAFTMSGNLVFYSANTSVVHNGTATTSTPVSLASFVPVTSRIATIYMRNMATNASVTVTVSGFVVAFALYNIDGTQITIPAANIAYRYDASPNAGFYANVAGYLLER